MDHSTYSTSKCTSTLVWRTTMNHYSHLKPHLHLQDLPNLTVPVFWWTWLSVSFQSNSRLIPILVRCSSSNTSRVIKINICKSWSINKGRPKHNQCFTVSIPKCSNVMLFVLTERNHYVWTDVTPELNRKRPKEIAIFNAISHKHTSIQTEKINNSVSSIVI